jgi:hypothetical protein
MCLAFVKQFDYEVYKYTDMAQNWLLCSPLQLRKAMGVSASNTIAVSSAQPR